jgi:branched-chain amino acid transport system permease protein
MIYLIEQIYIALMLSSNYILIAVGFTLFFGAINIVHFSHGDVAMIGSFIGIILYTLADLSGIHRYLPPMIVNSCIVVLTLGLVGILGTFFERTVIKPFRFSPMLITLVATVALGIVIREFVRLFYPQGSNPQLFPKIFPQTAFQFGKLIFLHEHLIILGIGILLIAAMFLFINHTRIGLAIRAISQDIEAASLMGINFDIVIAITFLIGSILAGVAGILTGVYFNVVKFDIGLMAGIKGFSAAVVGGLGNFYGAILGGLLLGFAESFVSAFIPGGSPYKDVCAFTIVIFFLIFRPSGIVGEIKYKKV